MNYTTKFDHGQQVHAIDRNFADRPVDCAACSNSGKVEINGHAYNCPGCQGRGKSIASVIAWYASRSGHLEVVRVEQTSDGSRITYMIGSTSGRVYDEEDIFATRAEADAECARRNAGAIERFERSRSVP